MKTFLLFLSVISIILYSFSAQANITNVTQGGAVYGTIQSAVDAANSGDRLLIGIGHYTENVEIRDKSLRLEGGYMSGFTSRTNLASLTCIDAGGSGVGLLAVSNATIALEYLMITNGTSFVGGGILLLDGVTLTADYCKVYHNTGLGGGGVAVGDNSTLVLNDSKVRDNIAMVGGGIYAVSNAHVHLLGNTSVSYNYAQVEGGGIYMLGTLVGQGWNAFIAYNIAGEGGGGISVPGGHVTLSPLHVANNAATNAHARGGGILVYNKGHLSIGLSGNVNRNSAYNGGGIYAEDAHVDLIAVLFGNTAENEGGGISLVSNSFLNTHATRIGFEMATRENTARYGGGIYTHRSTVVFNGRVINNSAHDSGGGIYVYASTVTLHNAHVGGVEEFLPNRIQGNIGAGIYVAQRSYVSITNTVIASNVFETAGFTYGGGMYVTGDSDVIMRDSKIAHHIAPSIADGRGAGIYISDSKVTLYNSQIISNTAAFMGGGVRMWMAGRLSLLEDSVLAYNQALNGAGGGLASAMVGTISITNAYIAHNRAETEGGAFYLDSGSIAFNGGWTLSNNIAGENGGAIALVDTAQASLRAHQYSLAYGNRAEGGHGGMIYVANDATIRLYATVDHEMHVYSNYASGNGGALYANNGGYFNIYGRVNIKGNRASNGGAIYLSNGSHVWLMYVDILPRLWDNVAESGSGGAIYAENSPSVRLTGAIMGEEGEGNSAFEQGGAIAAYNSTVLVQRISVFLDNTARVGGALAVSNTLVMLEEDHRHVPLFRGNSSFGTGATGGGGAIYAAFGSHVSGKNLIFMNNASTNHGGALWLRRATADLSANFSDWPGKSIPPILFSNNVAHTGEGGAIRLSHGSAARLSEAMVVDNRALMGGGLYINTSTIDVVNTVVYNNSAGIRMHNSSVRARHCTLIDNVNFGISGTGAISVSNSIVRGHVTINIQGGNDVHYSNVGGGYIGTGNIDEAPLFVDPTGYNFALRFDSPCVNGGVDVGIAWDCIGAPRPMNAGYDMGAYEMNPAPIQEVIPTVLDFGDVLIGDSASQNIQVANRGNTEVNGAVLYIPLPTFTVVPNTYSVPALDATHLVVTFSPAVEFYWTQTVVFASNGGTQDVVFIGTGVPEPTGLLLGVVLLGLVMRMRALRCLGG